MTNIRKFRERIVAREYLVARLAAGFSTLASLVHQKHRFTKGNFSVIAPGSVDIDSLARLGTEVRDADHSAAVRLLAKVVKGFICNRNCTVLLQDFVHHVSDPHWEEYEFQDRATTYNGEVYWEVKGTDIPEDKLKDSFLTGPAIFRSPDFFAYPHRQTESHLSAKSGANIAPVFNDCSARSIHNGQI
jgi:hypothetical protein